METHSGALPGALADERLDSRHRPRWPRHHLHRADGSRANPPQPGLRRQLSALFAAHAARILYEQVDRQRSLRPDRGPLGVQAIQSIQVSQAKESFLKGLRAVPWQN